VKTRGDKFGKDPFCDTKTFDGMSRQIRWSKNNFSHSLSPGALECELSFRFACAQPVEHMTDYFRHDDFQGITFDFAINGNGH
jgi:hypothetical protein